MSETSPVIPVSLPGQLSRRQAMQWVMAAVAAAALPTAAAPGSPPAAFQPAQGYGTDPNLLDVHKPGSIWPLTMTDAQRKAATALADTVLPKDNFGPAASSVGVPAMIDEWVSAPYPQQQADRPIILEGLAWLDAESMKRFGQPFAVTSDAQKHAICDDICYTGSAQRDFKKAALFFARFRALAAGAYYSTPAGWDAIGYVGNVPLTQFDGPPPEVLAKLGLVGE